MSLLSVKNLAVAFDTHDGTVHAVNGLSFELEQGSSIGIVGESGSGKSQTVLALMGLLARNGRVGGEVTFKGRSLLDMPLTELNRIRGNDISMIFQDPMTSLNPYLTISRQLGEVLTLHKGMSRAEAKRASIEMLDAVKIPEARKRIDMYPHEFSGGMRQRVMIAMALLCRPELLIADEPTTALDVTVQAQILQLLKELQQEFNTAIVMITHDLGVVAGLCDEVLVMYGGRTMEQGDVHQVFHNPQHPYTTGLLAALPRLGSDESSLRTIPGNPPNMLNMPAGCPFSERCPERGDRCITTVPLLHGIETGHTVACHKREEAA